MGTGVINRIITLGLPFIIRTIVIRTLGAEYLGLSSLFSSILQVLNMAELGFSSAVVFSLYKPIAEQDTNSICALMGYYRTVYKIIGGVILVGGSFLFPVLPKLIKGSYPSDINIYLLYAIYLVNTSISYLLFAYKNVLFSASQRQDILNNVNSVVSISKFVIQIIILLAFKNYYLYIIWNLVFTGIENILVAILAKRKYPEYICRGKIKKEKRNEISKQIKGLAIGQFTKVSRNSFDSIVLSMYCGLIDVAIYSNYYYIFNAVMGILSIIIQSVNAGIGNSIVSESTEKNYKDFKKFYFYFSCIGSACTICFVCLYQDFMAIWVGENYKASIFTMSLFCIYFYVVQMGLIRSAYANASGIWWECRWVQIAEMLCNLILNFALGYKWGMNGILLATIITVFIFSIIGLTKKLYDLYFKRKFSEYLMESLVYFAGTALVLAGTYTVTTFVDGDTIGGFIVKSGLTVTLIGILMGVEIFLIPQYRKSAIELLNKVRR